MTNLKIFASIVEGKAMDQINTLVAQPAFADCKVRIMPDVHAGKGCVIGFTADLGDKVIPNIVGVDIGCGMLTTRIMNPITTEDLKRLDEVIREHIPSGFNIHTDESTVRQYSPHALYCAHKLRNVDRIKNSLGTLGGGNHFIEVDKNEKGEHFLVIHSGSRNLGKQVAEIYQELAYDCCTGKAKFDEERRRIIAELKAAGRESEIQSAIAALKCEPSVPKELSYLIGSERLAYLHDMAECQEFARANRQIMTSVIFHHMGWERGDSFHTVHNYVDLESNIVRKGAVSAKEGEQLLIPINMRDGSLICIGKGNPDWNCSAPHGAGRLMSRAQAREKLSLAGFKATMNGVYTTSVCTETLDEAPDAYKPIETILPLLGDTVEVVDRLYPVYNFKATS